MEPPVPHGRAKIFMHFNPLEGFTEALRAKEAEVETAVERQGHGEDEPVNNET